MFLQKLPSRMSKGCAPSAIDQIVWSKISCGQIFGHDVDTVQGHNVIGRSAQTSKTGKVFSATAGFLLLGASIPSPSLAGECQDAGRCGAVAATASARARIIASSATTARLRFSAYGLPKGLAIDPASGEISGTIDRASIPEGARELPVTISFRDDFGGAGSTRLTIRIPNRPPVASVEHMDLKSRKPVLINLLANDVDPDGDRISLQKASADHGTVAYLPTGHMTYVPAPEWVGQDIITYTVSDGRGAETVGYKTLKIER